MKQNKFIIIAIINITAIIFNSICFLAGPPNRTDFAWLAFKLFILIGLLNAIFSGISTFYYKRLETSDSKQKIIVFFSLQYFFLMLFFLCLFLYFYIL